MRRVAMSIVLVMGTLGGTVVGERAARAQAQVQGAAEAAFRRGRELLAAGKVAEACPAFEQSQKLDPQLGTQYNLALCDERLGKTASAWTLFTELAARDSNPRRKQDSARRARALAPKLTRMVVRVAEPVAGLVVTQDGADITMLVGVESPVDPGSYRFEARAPGYRAWVESVAVGGDGALVSIDVPVLDAERKRPPAAAPVAAHRPAPPPSTEPARPASPGHTRRLIAYGTGGGGVVLTGVGLIFGLQAMHAQDEADELCHGSSDTCMPDDDSAFKRARDKAHTARSRALVSTVCVGAGIAAIAGGVVLYLTAPRDDEHADERTAVAPYATGDQVGVAVSGRF